ncbi:MAG TPA: Holliday junction resolvase RuvX [Candidatus Polarisedimenticolia bacterium]|nr:Holliday junction resolvase RuvX [Candidatus Polarisedimenticolia bacterium]
MLDPTTGDGADESAARILALDYGERRIGVALSDPLRLTAQALVTLTRRSKADDLEALKEMVRTHGVVRIVVGLPLAMNGTRTPMSRRAEEFAAAVGRVTGLPVETWDERLSTAQATRALLEGDVRRARRREVVDQVAAVLILQSYLDAGRAGSLG